MISDAWLVLDLWGQTLGVQPAEVLSGSSDTVAILDRVLDQGRSGVDTSPGWQ